ncbi:adenylate cyclase activating polypeptide 1b isoform X2 [Synchiropus splendidus]|uniref:adenylate cyclase activating polypeptide 1b isoform X2 n=1 Tax=Synchiropus splendidus TaxID=270530 RepID=UPI00237E8292|nr:adenylate cyclase activating polypeptide 1b isoform X2 [Synchiropus splendidus]
MAGSSRATLILLIYGIFMHYSVFCTPIGLSYPKIRLDNDAFDEDGNSLSDMGFDSDPIAIRSAPTLNDDGYLYYPPEKSEDNSMEDESEPLSKRHSDGIFTDSYSRYRKQMAVQKYLAAVLGRRYRQRVRNKGRRLAYL